MCGICGILDPTRPGEPRGELVTRMRDRLVHRGPDDAGLWQSGPVALAMRRLSIVDVEHGHQPMSTEDGQIWMVCNGEIYNAPALRNRLIAAGHPLRTRCDVEVIPYLYREHGLDFCRHLQGMFALALYDVSAQRLVLARDHVGIKPLYYADVGGRVTFGSEIKAILEDPEVPKEVDLRALHDYLSFGYALPPRTFWAGIRSVPPGTMLIWERGSRSERTYWTPPRATGHLGKAEAIDGFQTLMADVLEDHLLADVPVGAFLSGGIDSSLCVALSGRAGNRLSTVTVSFPDDYNEAAYAAVVARRWSAGHHEVALPAGAGDPDLVRAVVDHFDEPFGDSSAIPTYMVSQEARRFMKVAFSGDGGDELFGGYSQFVTAPLIRRASRVAPAASALLRLGGAVLSPGLERRLRKALAMAQLSSGEMVAELHTYMTEQEKREAYQPWLAEAMAGYSSRTEFAEAIGDDSDDVFGQVSRARLGIALPADMLRKVDMMSMFHGLEVRVPFLDPRVVEFAAGVPPHLKVRRGRTKVLLRDVARQVLPSELADRKKHGFEIPLDTWAGPTLRAFVSDQLVSPEALVRRLFRKEAVDLVVARFLTGQFDPSGMSRYQVYQRLYHLLVLEVWLRRHHPRIAS